MKFAYFGFDALAPCLEKLLSDGHQPMQIFSFFTDGRYDFNRRILNLAAAHNIPVSFSKPKKEELEDLAQRGCEIFISAAYAYKIPEIPETAYGINIHPTLLPKGRGKFPLPFILLEHRDGAGITIHKLSKNIDAGDIMYQKPIALNDNEDMETLTCKIVMHAPGCLSECMDNIKTFWQNARAQNEAEAIHFPYPPDSMRYVSWDMSMEEIGKIGRAFSRLGWMCELQGQRYWVFQYAYWHENHTFTPGSIVSVLDREIAVAARDGFVCLKEFEPVGKAG